MWRFIHAQHFAWLLGKRQWPLDGVTSFSFGAPISFQAAQTEVGEQVSSL